MNGFCLVAARGMLVALVMLSGEVAGAEEQPAIFRLRDQAKPATTVKQWLAQMEAATVQVTGVKLERTETGLDITLETAEGKPLKVDATKLRREGNSLIADIPNAVLALPQGQTFVADNPTADIATVQVVQRSGTIRVSVAGNNALPKTEVTLKTGGLAYSLNPEGDEPDEEIVVTGEGQRGYRVPNASTATRTDTPIRDIPQSIQVIPRQVLEDRQPTNLIDALRSVPGIVQQSQASTSIYENPVIRGFQAGEGDVLRDGTRPPYSNISSFDSVTIERIEVLRGPASVLFGQGSLGGIINVITKQPLSIPQYSVEFTAGSFDLYRGAIDLTGPLTDDKKLLYRLNFSGKNTGSFLDNFDRRQFTVAPTISWQISDNTNLKLSAEYISISGSYGQMGVPARGTILPNPNGKIPLSRNLSEPFDKDNVESFRIGYDLEHKFSDNWQLRSTFEVAWLEQDRVIIFPQGLAADNRNMRRGLTINPLDARNIILDNYFVGKFATGNIQHQLLAGFNYTRTDQKSIEPSGSRFTLAPIDIFNPIYGQPFGAPSSFRFEGESSSNAYGFYIQDQISLTDNLKLLLGGRFDIANQRIVNSYPTDSSAQQEVFSPRVGVVYQPIPAISLYAAYGRSFIPIINVFEDQTISKPERGTLYEVGIKADLSDRLSATLAFYDQTRTNIRTEDPNDPLRTIQVGEQNSRGVEFNIAGEILPGWSVIGGYAYTDAKVSRDNSFPVGNRINGVPENSFSLWTTYRIQAGNLRGLGFGFGLFYQGERQGNLANTFQLPSYLRTDAAIFYERDQLRVGLNFRNLFNIEYYEAAFNINRVFPGAPLEVQGTISWKF
jgi:iron complex outermembrane recepter protein